MTDRLYVYALADAPARTLRVRGRTVQFEAIGDVYAAVERRRAAPALTEEELRIQHAIVTAVASSSEAVLPARFGAFVDRQELARIVGLRHDKIQQALLRVRGRTQMNVRILDAGGIPPTVRATGSPSGRRPGTRYLLQRRAASRGRIPSTVVRALRDAAARLVLDERVEPGEGLVAARVYHLIARGADRSYRLAVEAVVQAQARYRIAVAGPWPPFAFVPEIWP